MAYTSGSLDSSQVQILSNQVATLTSTLTHQSTNTAVTAEILCFMVQAVRDYAPAPVANLFQAWRPGSYGPHSSRPHSSSTPRARTRTRPRHFSHDSFSARIDPVEEDTPAPPHPPSAACPPHVESAAPPTPPSQDESDWHVPLDWDAQRDGSRKLRREGAFMHTPNWDAMRNVHGRTAEDGGSGTNSTWASPSARPAQPSPTESTRSSDANAKTNSATCAHPHRADSPDRAELERRFSELQAYVDAGLKGRLPPYENQMKDRRSGAGPDDTPPGSTDPVEPPSRAPTTPKKRSRSQSQSRSPSPACSSPSPHAPTDTVTAHEEGSDDDGDSVVEPRTAKRRRVSPASRVPVVSSSIADQPVYRTPEPTPVPEPLSAALPSSAATSSSEPRIGTQARQRPLMRTATMAHFD